MISYDSCGEALLSNNLMDKEYFINLYGSVSKFKVFCKHSENFTYETIIGNDQEENRTVSGYEPDYSYHQKISYSTLIETEMTKFLYDQRDCEQTMFFDSFLSRGTSSKFVFWDGTSYSLEDASDGICKCIISQHCLDKQLSNLTCLNLATSNPVHSPLITHFGKLSVKSERLPLKEIYIGDTGSGETVTFSIGKLVCQKRYPIFIKSDEKCLHQKIFTDNKTDTCYTLQKPNQIITIISLNPNIKVLGENSKCLKIAIYSLIEENHSKL